MFFLGQFIALVAVFSFILIEIFTTYKIAVAINTIYATSKNKQSLRFNDASRVFVN
jgi:hypothetical protein